MELAWIKPLASGDIVTVTLKAGGLRRGKIVRVNGPGTRVVVELFAGGAKIERRIGEVERA